MELAHVPVMLGEVLDALNLKMNGIYVDATVGPGGHAQGILERVPKCTLIGVDQDDQAIAMARQRLGRYSNVHLVRDDFVNIRHIVKNLGCELVDGILIDPGVSTIQLREKKRGFSFHSNERLDMRMNRRQTMTAEKIVNTYSVEKLADVIWRFGDERFSRKIAKAVVQARKQKPIRLCSELSHIIESVVFRKGRIHPATRTFQALRIEVNRELEKMSTVLTEGADILASRGRCCVLSYHSLEDRIIKNAFKELARKGLFHIITKKPVVPGRKEKLSNPSARSAKLRVAEKV